jgi:hypothetical protein
MALDHTAFIGHIVGLIERDLTAEPETKSVVLDYTAR